MSMTFATDVVVNNGQSVQTNKVLAPTSSGGSTYGTGTSGQVLTSNGTNVYWASASGGGTDIVYSASTAPSSPTEGMVWLKQAPISLEEAKILVLSTTTSSLPTTISNSAITNDMVVLKSELGSPSAQASDLTVTTSAGSLTIAGTLSGSTTITLYLLRSR